MVTITVSAENLPRNTHSGVFDTDSAFPLQLLVEIKGDGPTYAL